MAHEITLARKRGRASVFPKPETEDPFVNSGLVSLGVDRRGLERFAISSLNGTTGARTLVLDERGAYRAYAWPKGARPTYCYGAVAGGDPDTVWMGGGGPAGPGLYRLTLSSGALESYPAPAGHYIQSGLAYDPDTKKVFTGCGSAMVSFDTVRRKYIRTYSQEEMGPCHFHWFHWRNPDGSYGFLLETPGLTYVRWFPQEERIDARVLIEDPRHPALRHVRTGSYIKSGKIYIPHLGWLNGLTGRVARCPRPPREEATWFGAIGNVVYGIQSQDSGDSKLLRWDARTGDVRTMAVLADHLGQGIALTRSGRILAVDLHGLIQRFDARSGALERTVKYEHRDVHLGHAVCPAGKDRVVGTPFICQNFWILDTKTGKGQDGGRAAASYGQIDAALTVNGKVYFIAYGGSQLTEFDPGRPANWPRNPRLVAKSDQGQHGAGMATDGQIVWAAFKPLYGTLDGALIRYDTKTGEAAYRNASLKNQHVLNPLWDPATKHLVAGTSFLSDAGTAVPVCDRVYAVTMDPVTMDVVKRAIAPRGLRQLMTVGPLGGRNWLMRGDDGRLGVFDEAACAFASDADMIPLPKGAKDILYAGTPGLFLVTTDRSLRLWDFPRDAFSDMAVFRKGFLHRCWVHGKSVYCDCVHKVAVLENVLP
ncbi:MAG: hypothetical protein EXS64_03665 [Candidatus Latescibacteria bacterium]|nr:hypothetical protein [Candidatus Latescibacterota bacterium]